MTIALLLLISFILHIITLTAIYQLVKQINAIKQNSTDDILELMETYLEEIKEENRLLEAKLTHTHAKEYTVQSETENTSGTGMLKEDNPLPDWTSDPKITDTFETSLQSRVLQLHEEGLSLDKIASQLHCGKTEVELIIKLHAKNDNNT
ncbi:hypothetical protein WMZ97_02120 [Lentibacillus sp. N15]|uniref:DUF6115 domain-containing protein n=1 Tax=Lentibacillus songyuanensis TaxID=3136161 RepID=UPI0031BA1549